LAAAERLSLVFNIKRKIFILPNAYFEKGFREGIEKVTYNMLKKGVRICGENDRAN
jgi:hypothetical protein